MAFPCNYSRFKTMFKYAIKRNKANIPLWVEINVLKTIENINKYILTILFLVSLISSIIEEIC